MEPDQRDSAMARLKCRYGEPSLGKQAPTENAEEFAFTM